MDYISHDDHAVIIDADQGYPLWLGALGVSDKVDEYWLEVCHQCMKFDAALYRATQGVQRSMNRIKGGKPKFSQADAKPGRFSDVKASKGDQAFGRLVNPEAREHYRKVRGFLPN